jgi:multicomponent Na+:H+ antiporter subunit C
MSPSVLYALMGVALISIGVHGLIAHAHLLRKILAVNVMGSGVFAILVAMAWRNPEGVSDPVPHALVLTGIVVAVSATAFALALTCRIHEQTGAACLPEEDHDEAV